MKQRLLLVIVFTVLGTWFSTLLDAIWTDKVLSGITFSEPFGLNLLAIADWGPALLVFIPAAVVFTKLTNTTATCYWSLGLGLLAASYWFLTTKILFVETPSIADLIWTYSRGLIPMVGSLLGWLLFRHYQSLRPDNYTTN